MVQLALVMSSSSQSNMLKGGAREHLTQEELMVFVFPRA